MKKVLVISSIVVAALALVVGVVVPFVSVAPADLTCSEWCYVNNNGISMTKDRYDLLQSIGFNEFEIDNMSEERFDKFMSMEFLHTKRDTRLYDSISITDNTEKNNDLFNPLNGIRLASASEPEKYKRYTTQDETKIMDTFVSFAESGSGHKIFVKQNLYWTTCPEERFTDTMSINYTNNIRLSADYEYPDVNMRFGYVTKEIFKSGTSKPIENRTDIEYTGADTAHYSHEIGKKIAFSVSLPEDTINENSILLHSQFYIAMDTLFDTNFSTVTGTALKSQYVHQLGVGAAFTKDPPYIIQAPKLEREVFSYISITFDDEWLSR